MITRIAGRTLRAASGSSPLSSTGNLFGNRTTIPRSVGYLGSLLRISVTRKSRLIGHGLTIGQVMATSYSVGGFFRVVLTALTFPWKIFFAIARFLDFQTSAGMQPFAIPMTFRLCWFFVGRRSAFLSTAMSSVVLIKLVCRRLDRSCLQQERATN